MKHINYDHARSPLGSCFLTDLTPEEAASMNGGIILFRTGGVEFLYGAYDGFCQGFGSWVKNGFLK